MNKSQRHVYISITVIISVDSKMAVMLLKIMVVERTRCLQLPSVFFRRQIHEKPFFKTLLETCILQFSSMIVLYSSFKQTDTVCCVN